MYLYPWANGTYLYNMCVPDCPTVNYQMVNNPEYGRCEFLGYYCKYGDAQRGCKESYLQGCKALTRLL